MHAWRVRVHAYILTCTRHKPVGRCCVINEDNEATSGIMYVWPSASEERTPLEPRKRRMEPAAEAQGRIHTYVRYYILIHVVIVPRVKQSMNDEV
jgi:hypothetical protein